MPTRRLEVGPEAAGERLDVFLAGRLGRARGPAPDRRGRVTVDGERGAKNRRVAGASRSRSTSPRSCAPRPGRCRSPWSTRTTTCWWSTSPRRGRAPGRGVDRPDAGRGARGTGRRRPRPRAPRGRAPPGPRHVGAAGGGAHRGRLRGAAGSDGQARDRARVPGPGRGRPARPHRPHRRAHRARPPGAHAHVDRHRHAARGAHAVRARARARRRRRRRCCACRSRPAAPTRSACTWPRSATPWPATPSTGRPGRFGLQRQFLHADRLAFAHPVTGEPLAFTSPLPADLEAALRAL